MTVRDVLWRAMTGTPWTTTRSMVAEFGPTPATVYPHLAQLYGADLIAQPQLRSPGWAYFDMHKEVSR